MNTSANSVEHRRVLLVSAAYYGAVTVVLTSLVLKLQSHVLPAGVATQVGHNSEVFALALGLPATVQFARPWWRRASNPWPRAFVLAALWVAAAAAIYYLDTPSTVRTLNEPLLALGVLTLYLVPERPARGLWLVAVVTVLVVVVGFDTAFVRQQAECLVAVALVSMTVDVTDRRVLQPASPASPALAGAWYFLLLLWPALMLALNDHRMGGVLGSAVNYQARGAEAFWGTLVACLFLRLLGAIGGLTGVSQRPSRAQATDSL